jgi:hypothetical protein
VAQRQSAPQANFKPVTSRFSLLDEKKEENSPENLQGFVSFVVSTM